MVDKMTRVIHNLSAAQQASLARDNINSIKEQTVVGQIEKTDENQDIEDVPGKNFLSYGPEGLIEEKQDAPSEDGDEDQDATGDDIDDGDDTSDGSTSEDAAEESADEDKNKTAPKRNKQTAKERIAEVTRARRQAERDAEDQRQQNQELLKRLEALEQGKPAPRKAQETKKPDSAKIEEGAPDPKDYDFGEVDSKYIADLVDWKAEQRLNAFRDEQRQEKEQLTKQQESERLKEKLDAHIAKGTEKYADYEKVVLEGAAKGDWDLSPELARLILQSDIGYEIAYHLASHPDEAERVYKQTPLEQAVYFGAVEARLSPNGAPKTASVTKAPEPVQQARGGGGKFKVAADTDDFESFRRMASKELNGG